MKTRSAERHRELEAVFGLGDGCRRASGRLTAMRLAWETDRLETLLAWPMGTAGMVVPAGNDGVLRVSTSQ
ncbi:MAG: hypothetical protein L0Z07_06495 [Planctomycetes bacterium]|nr:hypothetical protein [Planctomycetota bacterium]